MKMFIIVGLAMSVMVGLFMAILITSAMQDGWKRNVVTIVLALVIGFTISGLLMAEKKADKEAWNHGYCQCGGEWHLTDVEHLRNSGDLYYYSCNNCCAMIELHSNYTR